MLEQILTAEQLPIWADEYAQAVVAAYHPDCIILFGSVARNSQKRDSDIDILVIGGEMPASARERFRLLMRLRPWLAPIQVQTFTRPEWEKMLAAKHVTALEALKDGKPLHGKRLFARWRQEFRRWQAQGLYRTECTWVIPVELRSGERWKDASG